MSVYIYPSVCMYVFQSICLHVCLYVCLYVSVYITDNTSCIISSISEPSLSSVALSIWSHHITYTYLFSVARLLRLLPPAVSALRCGLPFLFVLQCRSNSSSCCCCFCCFCCCCLSALFAICIGNVNYEKNTHNAWHKISCAKPKVVTRPGLMTETATRTATAMTMT